MVFAYAYWYSSFQNFNLGLVIQSVFFFLEQDNEFLIGWENADKITVTMQLDDTNIHLSSGYNLEDLWTNWHRHCFTWKASGQIKVCLFVEIVLLYRISSIVNFASFYHSFHTGFIYNFTSLC